MQNYETKTQEQRMTEESKFDENNRMLKAGCRLLNHSLDFMIIICSCLQI